MVYAQPWPASQPFLRSLFGNIQAGQDLPLSFRSPSSMTAHNIMRRNSLNLLRLITLFTTTYQLYYRVRQIPDQSHHLKPR
jgi:hypothetical protein